MWRRLRSARRGPSLYLMGVTKLHAVCAALVASLELTGAVGLLGQGQSPSATARDPARWLRVDRRPGVVVYVDRVRTHLIDSTHADAWLRWDVADSVSKMPKKVDQMLNRWAIDCRRMEAVDVEDWFYYRGAAVEHYVIPLADRTVTTTPPEGAGE